MANMLELIKKAAVDAVAASKPVGVLYGKVVGVSPLRIQVDQRLTLDEDFLVLTRNVTDYEIEMTVNHVTETQSSHSHGYVGKKVFTVHNALKIGDRVLLLMAQGGQSYVVLDKVV